MTLQVNIEVADLEKVVHKLFTSLPVALLELIVCAAELEQLFNTLNFSVS